MYPLRSTVLVCLLLIILSACSSGKKALKQGDYLEAVKTSIERLRKSPNNDNAREVLATAYPLLLEYNIDRIRQERMGSNPLRWEEVLAYYDELNKVYDEIQRSPAAREVIRNPRLFQSEFEEVRLKAAEARYVLGQRAMTEARRGDREAAKQAYLDFTRAGELSPGFRDAGQLASEARQMAIVSVVVQPIPMPTRYLEISNEFFYNKLMEFLKGSRISPFVDFYSLQEARSLDLQPDQVIAMAFDEFVIGDAYIRENIEKRQRDSVVVGQVEVIEDGEKVQKDVYGTVKAEVHLFQKELNSRAVLNCRILQSEADLVLAQERFGGSFTWADFWGYYNGDERALTGQDKERLRNRREVMPPPPEDLFAEVTNDIYGRVADFLADFYRGY